MIIKDVLHSVLSVVTNIVYIDEIKIMLSLIHKFYYTKQRFAFSGSLIHVYMNIYEIMFILTVA